MKFVVPIRIVSESNAREHWAAKAGRVKKQREAVAWLVPWREDRPPLPVIVTLTRIAPRPLDDDNLARSFKAVRDELAWCLGLPVRSPKQRIADDSDPRVEWKYGQRRGNPKEYLAEIEIRHKGDGT